MLNKANLVVDVADNILGQLFNIEAANSTQPIFACVTIDSDPHRSIVDSDSSVSLIIKAAFDEKFASHEIKTQKFNVCTYNGGRVNIIRARRNL